MKFARVLSLSFCLLTSTALSAASKTYQVTGPVLDLTDTTITVQKGSEKWQIDREATTKVEGELKVGVKVTIEYSMKAVTISAKVEKPKKPGK